MEEKVYTVVSLSNLDAAQLDDDSAEANKASVPYFESIYNSLTDSDKQWLADYVGEWLYDHEQFQDALRGGLNVLMLDRAKANA